jgi:hypothetical protein
MGTPKVILWGWHLLPSGVATRSLHSLRKPKHSVNLLLDETHFLGYNLDMLW